MLDSAREAVSLVEGRSRVDLDSDRLLGLGLVRLLEIVGEAARHVSPDVQTIYPEIPWAEIVSLRNRLIHGYQAVDYDVLWEIVNLDLPSLVGVLTLLVTPEK